MLTSLLGFVAIVLVAFGLGLYVAVAMGLGGMTLAWLVSDRPLWDILGHISWNTTTSVTLVALPLFILMGEILLRSGVSEAMYQTLAKWLNNLPGGLLHTNIAASAVFACVSGSSAATCATIGGISLPFLRAYGYSERLALGSLAAGGTLGILIPPSITFIVYGVLVEESIGRLYIAAVVPGLMMTVALMTVVYVAARLRPAIAPRGPASSWPDRLAGLLKLVPVIILMLLVLGTIYLGVATATEAAAFGVTGAFVIALLNRRINRQMLRETFLVAASATSMVLFILIGAFVLQFVVAFLGLPQAMSGWIIGLGLSRTQVVIMISLLYLALGTFMEELSMIVTTIPVLLPLLKALGVDLVWFGVIVVILVQTAIVSPPVGMNFFILQGIRTQLADGKTQPIADIFVGALPFLLAMVSVLALVIMFPQLALWLVGTAKAS